MQKSGITNQKEVTTNPQQHEKRLQKNDFLLINLTCLNHHQNVIPDSIGVQTQN